MNFDYQKDGTKIITSEKYERVKKNYGITPETIKQFNLKIESDNNIKIWQLYHDDNSYKGCQDGFIHLKNIEPDRNLNPFQENYTIIHVYYNQIWQDLKYLGFVSWRFYEKTKLNYENVVAKLDNNDIYSLTPKRFAGKKHHYQCSNYEGMIEICKFVDDAKILPIKITGLNGVDSYCNYWILTPERFKEYIEKWLLPCYNLFMFTTNIKWKQYKMSHRQDKYATIVFFFEGLFSAFLHDKKFKYIHSI